MKDRKIKNREIISDESPMEFRAEYTAECGDFHKFHFLESSPGSYSLTDSVTEDTTQYVFHYKTSENGCSCPRALGREFNGMTPSCLHRSVLKKLIADVEMRYAIEWEEELENERNEWMR